VNVLELYSTQLVQQAPDLDATTLAQLRDELLAVGSPLALSIARIYELVELDVVDPAIALPALAEACATLVAGIEGRLGPREVEAARYQIDTLQPLPDKPPRVATPDVPITQLRKKP
jgi:hypothetical protein